MIVKGRNVSTCLTALLILVPIASAKLSRLPSDNKTSALTRWQWIGLKSNNTPWCPLPAGGRWQVSQLFTGMAEAAPPPGLQHFCKYKYAETGAVTATAQASLLALVGNGLDRIDSDAMAVSSSGKTATQVKDAMWLKMANHFAEQTEMITVEGSHYPRARLAILDTAPTGVGFPLQVTGNSPHGYTLLHMAKDLLCPNAICLAQLTSRLTMPYVTFHPSDPSQSEIDLEHGGLVGTLSDLAQAIQAEMQQAIYNPGDTTIWREPFILDSPGKQQARVVLNLSLGWDPVFGGAEADPSQMPANVQAVYAALQDAVCRGALVFAAAGNYREGPGANSDSNIGPLLPAAWEQRAAPTALQCQKVLEQGDDEDDHGGGANSTFGRKNSLFIPTTYTPLVHSVGGLRSNGLALANARQQGAPRLAAYADHAVVESHLEGTPTAMLTGSSVASLVAAATATAAWSLDAENNSHEIAQRLYDTGSNLQRDADYCFGNTCLEVHRLAFCPVLESTCSILGSCPVLIAACSRWQPDSPLLNRDAMIQASSNRQFVDASELTLLDTTESAACGSEERYAESQPQDLCPERQYLGISAQAWLAPQPASDPCETCTLFPNSCCYGPETLTGSEFEAGAREKNGPNYATLLIDIDPDFEGVLTGATLTVCEQAYSFPLAALKKKESALIDNIQIGTCGSALLSFRVDGLDIEEASTTSAPLIAGTSIF